MTASVPTATVARYLEFALAGDQRPAVQLVLDQLDEGVPVEQLIGDLLRAAQSEAGERWHRGEWSTADEHLVTGVSQASLEALVATAPAVATEGLVVVACAEDDWHSLASQLFAELLRSSGQGVVYLGASTPAEDVDRFIERRRPDALTITCSLALAYVGTARLSDAAHRHGVPVLAGGRALTEGRAAALGADAWAPDAAAGAAILRHWRRSPPVVGRGHVALDQAALELDARAVEVADEAFGDLEQRFPQMRDYDARQRRRTHEDLVYIVRFLAAALLVDDDEVFRTFRSWLERLLVARGVPAAALTAGLDSLAPLLRDVDERAYRLATVAAGSHA